MKKLFFVFLLLGVALSAHASSYTQRSNLETLSNGTETVTLANKLASCTANGGKIYLKAQTYTGAVSITQPCTIEGVGRGSIVDSGVDGTPSITIATTGQVILKNFAITNRAIDGSPATGGGALRRTSFGHFTMEDMTIIGGTGGATSRPPAISLADAPDAGAGIKTIRIKNLSYEPTVSGGAGPAILGTNEEVSIDDITLNINGMNATSPLIDYATGATISLLTSLRLTNPRMVAQSAITLVKIGGLAGSGDFIFISDAPHVNDKILDLTSSGWSGTANLNVLSGSLYGGTSNIILNNIVATATSATTSPRFRGLEGKSIATVLDTTATGSGATATATGTLFAPFLAGLSKIVISGELNVTNTTTGNNTLDLKLAGTTLHTITYTVGVTGRTKFTWEIIRTGNATQRSTFTAQGAFSTATPLYATATANGLIDATVTGVLTNGANAANSQVLDVFNVQIY